MGGGGPNTADVTRQCAPGSCPTPPGGHPSVGTGRLPTAARHAPPLPAANDRQEAWRGHVGPRRGGSCSERGTGAALPLFLPLAPAQARVGPLGGASLTGPQRHRHSLQTPYGPHRRQTGPTDHRQAPQTPGGPHRPQIGPTNPRRAPQTPYGPRRPQTGSTGPRRAGGSPRCPAFLRAHSRPGGCSTRNVCGGSVPPHRLHCCPHPHVTSSGGSQPALKGWPPSHCLLFTHGVLVTCPSWPQLRV